MAINYAINYARNYYAINYYAIDYAPVTVLCCDGEIDLNSIKVGKGNDASLVAREIRELFSNF